jgi:hypothetical protein
MIITANSFSQGRLFTFKGHVDSDVKDGNDFALALVNIHISSDRGDGEGLDGSPISLGSDTAELGLEISLCPVDAVLVNPVPKREKGPRAKGKRTKAKATKRRC